MARNSYGQGALRKRGDVWHYDLMVEGVRLRGSTGQSDRKKAQRELDRKIGERVRGELQPTVKSGLTVSNVLDNYIEKCCAGLKEKTINGYRGHSENRLKPFFGDILVKDLTSEKIVEYREMRAKQTSQTNMNAVKAKHYRGGPIKTKKQRSICFSTINRELSTLRAALQEMRRSHPKQIPNLPYIPMDDEKSRVRKGFISEAELKDSLIPSLPGHLRPLVVCGFYCGGRAGEWLGLDWRDVDFEQGLIHFADTKSSRPREVPIFDGFMLETLEKHKTTRDTLWPSLDAVFTYDGENRLRVFRRSWGTAMKKTKFPGLIFHDLRRSANRWMRGKNIPQAIRMAIIGHATASMDLRYGVVDRTDIDVAKDLAKK